MAKVYATSTAHFCTGDVQSACLMAGVSIVQHNKEVSKWWYADHVWNSSHLETFEPDFWDLLFLARRGCSLDIYKTCQKNSAFLLFWSAEQLISQDIPWSWKTWPISPLDINIDTDLHKCSWLLTPTSNRTKLRSCFGHHTWPQKTLSFPFSSLLSMKMHIILY